jgi:hypothetical protein
MAGSGKKHATVKISAKTFLISTNLFVKPNAIPAAPN